MDPPAWLWQRARLVGGAALVGAAVGLLALVALWVLLGDVAVGAQKAVGTGAVVAGFGVLSWSGAVMIGDGYEQLQAHLDIESGWTEERGRRAMARVSGFGGGWLAATLLASLAVGV